MTARSPLLDERDAAFSPSEISLFFERFYAVLCDRLARIHDGVEIISDGTMPGHDPGSDGDAVATTIDQFLESAEAR